LQARSAGAAALDVDGAGANELLLVARITPLLMLVPPEYVLFPLSVIALAPVLLSCPLPLIWPVKLKVAVPVPWKVVLFARTIGELML